MQYHTCVVSAKGKSVRVFVLYGTVKKRRRFLAVANAVCLLAMGDRDVMQAVERGLGGKTDIVDAFKDWVLAFAQPL